MLPNNESNPGRRRRRTTRAALEHLERRQLLSTYDVYDRADAGPGSLRQAILDANANPGPDLIRLNVDSNPQVILQTPLPAITDPVTIDSSGPGLQLIPAEIDGQWDGLVLSGSGITVRHLSLEGFRNGVVSTGAANALEHVVIFNSFDDGVRVPPGGGLTVTSCRIYANAGLPIDAGSDGPTPNDATDSDGVANHPLITATHRYFVPGDPNPLGAVVEATFHGRPNATVLIEVYSDRFADPPGLTRTVTTDANGDATFSGLYRRSFADFSATPTFVATATYDGRTSELSPAAPLGAPAADVFVVTTNADAGTGSLRQAILDANAAPGRQTILFHDVNDIHLLSALPNVTDPLVIDGVDAITPNNEPIQLIGPAGAPTPGVDGLRLLTSDSVVRNLALTNFRHGIVIAGSNNVIGGAAGGPVGIYRNTGDGVRVTSGAGNRIGPAVNISFNGGVPIDLGGDGPDPNDPLDSDAGPNGRQNYPILNTAIRQGGNVVVTGVLRTAPGAYHVDLYALPQDDPGVYLRRAAFALGGGADVTVGPSGEAAFTATVPGPAVIRTSRLFATATDSSGNTSETGFVLTPTFPTVTVTSAADSGPGTLRQVILDANTDAAPLVVRFDIPGAGTHRITLASALPTLAQAIVLDATTQPGWAGSPVIELSGQSPFDGLTFGTGAFGSEVRGFAIGGFAQGIASRGGQSVFRGNYLGLDLDGHPHANRIGVSTWSNDVVGGLDRGDGNVISANADAGIYNTVYGVRVLGNRIGTDPAAATAVPNGVGIVNNHGKITIGGTVRAARNVISGNTAAGILAYLDSGSAVIQGNYIGTDARGERAIPNAVGIDLDTNGPGAIGGAQPGAGNVVAGNLAAGIHLATGKGYLVPVLGNLVGVSASGKPLGNGAAGIVAEGGTIGGTNAAEANVIAHNGGPGVAVLAGFLTPVPVRGNSIYANAGLGIDLAGDGPTPNDPADNDLGPNLLQNFPVLTAVTATASSTTITVDTSSLPGGPHTVDFYASPYLEAGGLAEGKIYLGSATVPEGAGTFSVTLPKSAAGLYVTATAQETGGIATSEFAPPLLAPDAVPPQYLGFNYVDFAGDQRLELTFSEDVGPSLGPEDIQIVARTPGVAVPSYTVTFDPDANRATIRFTGGLPDGDYRATLLPTGVADRAGNPLAAGATIDFFALPGDVNRDRTVDFADLVILAQNYNQPGKSYAEGDATGDGVVDFNDLVVVAQRYNRPIPLPPDTPPAAVAAALAAPAKVTAKSAAPAKKPQPVFSAKPITPTKPATPPPTPKRVALGRRTR